MVPKKPGKEFEPSVGEKKSTAEAKPEQPESKPPAKAAAPQPPEDSSKIEPPWEQPLRVQPAGPVSADMPGPRATPPPGYTAGTAITVTPYRKAGNGSFFMVGTVLVGSEQAACESLKNQLFRPPIAS